MSLLNKLVRYSQFSTGDFEKIFADFQVPPCPQVVLTLMDKLRNPDIDIEQIVSVLESDPSLASRILRIVNSALYSLPAKITSVSKAVSIMGLREIENLAIAYAMTRTVNPPEWEGFDVARYWSDSILRALFARNSADVMGMEKDEAFSASLLQDIAVPQILSQWFELYSRVYSKWVKEGGDIHQMEKEAFSWNHCDAGAWIAKDWGLPDLFICCIGLHGAKQSEIRELGLQETPVAPVALSAGLTQAGFSEAYAAGFVEETSEAGIKRSSLLEITEASEILVDVMASVFGVRTTETPSITESIAALNRT